MPAENFPPLDQHEELFWEFVEDHEQVDRWFQRAKAEIDRIDPSLVTQEQVAALTTAMLVESDNPVYMMELLASLRPYQYLAAFIPIWGEEEVKHFLILKLALLRLGLDRPMLDQMIDATRAARWEIPPSYSPAMIAAYTTFQEQLTALFYEGLAARCQDPVLRGILRRTAKDERRHHAYYRKLTKAFLADDRSGQTKSDVRQALVEFEMPGGSIVADYSLRAQIMVQEAGITIDTGRSVIKTVHEFVGPNPLETLNVVWTSVLGQQARATGWDVTRVARQIVMPRFSFRPAPDQP